MAYLRELARCCQTCEASARYELFSRENASIGLFCPRCAKVALGRLLDAEEKRRLLEKAGARRSD